MNAAAGGDRLPLSDEELVQAAIMHVGDIPHARRPARLAVLSIPHQGNRAAASTFWNGIAEFVRASEHRIACGPDHPDDDRIRLFALEAGASARDALNLCPILCTKVAAIARRRAVKGAGDGKPTV